VLAQDREFKEAYGEAMFYAHLIEDLLALHIYECGYFHVNGYRGLSRREIREMSHEDRINELAKIYHDQQDGSLEYHIPVLHLLRKIRNKLTHAFIPQVGSDVSTEEGIDQILAMLRNITTWERLSLEALSETHKTALREGIKHCFEAALARDDPPFDARVSRSKIQSYLDQLKGYLKA